MRRQIPITGIPATRPACPNCARPLRPSTRDTERKVAREGGGFRTEVVAREFRAWHAYDQLWCRLKCAREFATAAHRAGYRRPVCPI